MDLMASIMQVCGCPPDDFLEKCMNKNEYFTTKNLPTYVKIEKLCPGAYKSIGYTVKGKPSIKPGSCHIQELIGDSDTNLIDFIKQCLNWHPDRRLSAFQALNHPWLKETLTEPMFRNDYPLPLRVKRQFTRKKKDTYRNRSQTASLIHPPPKQSKSETVMRTCIPTLPVLKSLSVD